MAELGVLRAQLRMETAQFQRGIFRAKEELTGLQNVGRTAFLGIAAGAALIGAVSTVMATRFDTSMTKVKALTGATASEMKMLHDAILQLAPVVGKSPKELADALYFIESAGFHGAAAVNVLTYAAKASASGLGETKIVADALTSSLIAYKSSGLTARQATDQLVAAVTKGKVPADQLAGALGRVIGVSASLGIGHAEMLANISTLTRTGQSASQAATSLLGVLMQLTRMQDPTTKQAEALKTLHLSVEQVTSAIAQHGLAAALQMIIQHANGNTEALVKLFPNVRALRDILGTAGVQGKAYADILNVITNASDGSGRAQKAFTITQKNFEQQLKEVLAQLQVYGIVIGEWIIPKIKAFASGVADAVDWLAKNKVVAEALAIVIGGFLTAAITSFIALKVVSWAQNIQRAFVGLIGSMQSLVAVFYTTEAAAAAENAALETETATVGVKAAAHEQLTLALFETAAGEEAVATAGLTAAGMFAVGVVAVGALAAGFYLLSQETTPAQQAISDFNDTVGDLNTKAPHVRELTINLRQALKDLAEYNRQATRQNIEAAKPHMSRTGGRVHAIDHVSALPMLTDDMTKFIHQGAMAGETFLEIARSAGVTGRALNSLDEQLLAHIRKNWDGIAAAQVWQQSQSQLAAGIQAFTAVNKGALPPLQDLVKETSKQKAVAQEAALAVLAHGGSLKEATAKLMDYKTQLAFTLVTMGYSATAADLLATKLLGIPRFISTHVGLDTTGFEVAEVMLRNKLDLIGMSWAKPGVGTNIGGGSHHFFAQGGIVPGPVGAPVLATVHGGEEVLRPDQRGGKASVINLMVEVPASPQPGRHMIKQIVIEEKKSGSGWRSVDR